MPQSEDAMFWFVLQERDAERCSSWNSRAAIESIDFEAQTAEFKVKPVNSKL
jgi:hypothetical protein